MLDYPLADVLDLIGDHLDHQRRTPTQQPENIRPQPRTQNTEQVIYREADDSWL